MHFLNISSYPARWRRLLWSVSLLAFLSALEGIGTLLWFIAHPSEPGSRVFLSYSLERWILILATTTLLLVFLFSLWAIRFRTGWIESLLKLFARPKQAGKLLASVTVLLILAAGLMIWLPRIEAAQAYYARMLPLLLCGLVILAQVWIFLVALNWQTIVSTFQVCFPVNREKQIYPLNSTNRFLLLALIGFSLVYLVLQVLSYLNVREAILIGDSWSYLYGAGLDLTDPAFFSERRPWAILLVYKVLGSSQGAIELFQLSMSALAWLWLAWAFIRSVKNQWIKLIGFSGILGFSLSPTVQVWNHTVLSESLSISLMVLILGLFAGLTQQWKWRYLSLLILLFLFWMSFREANAYVALFVSFALFIMGLAQRTFRAYWVLSFFIGVIFLINYQLSSAYALPRWALPMAEVITKRILPNQEYLEYFAENGMPVTPELMALSGRWANSDDYAVINSTELKKFTRWLFNDARNVYVKFLITHPVYAIKSPLAEIQTLLGSDHMLGIPVPDYVPVLPSQVNELFYPVSWFWVYLWLSLISTGFIFATGLRTSKSIYWFILAFLLLSIPHLYLVWHGDALDVARHAVLANIQFHLGVWLLIVLYVDRVITNQVSHLDLSSSRKNTENKGGVRSTPPLFSGFYYSTAQLRNSCH